MIKRIEGGLILIDHAIPIASQNEINATIHAIRHNQSPLMRPYIRALYCQMFDNAIVRNGIVTPFYNTDVQCRMQELISGSSQIIATYKANQHPIDEEMIEEQDNESRGDTSLNTFGNPRGNIINTFESRQSSNPLNKARLQSQSSGEIPDQSYSILSRFLKNIPNTERPQGIISPAINPQEIREETIQDMSSDDDEYTIPNDDEGGIYAITYLNNNNQHIQENNAHQQSNSPSSNHFPKKR